MVGPNGSGKSNVVDALTWVMGEQGAKTLRGGAMSDVIFAGTTSRPPLGRAEVSLTIDNADGALPIAYSEVTISRTLFRNGGSEYAINGTPCRLLDIQELLSDTGMGREMHVVVGQGRLDSVLTATPEDRRGFIEEAAGVLKHRRRKDKALRKLDAMSANLQRVTDLTAEIRRQLGPLARQADVARRASVIQADVRDARARLLADDVVQAASRLAADTAGEEELKQRKAEIDEALATGRDQLAASERDAAHLAPRVRQSTDSFYALAGLRERYIALVNVAVERGRLLGTVQSVRTGDDPAELDQRAERAACEEAELAAEVEAARLRMEEAASARSAAETAERAAEHRLAAVQRGEADRREGLARLTGQVSTRRSRLESAEAELGRAREALASARQRAAAAEAEYASLEQEVAGAEDGEIDLDAAHEEALAVEHAAVATLADLEEEERAAAADLANASTRAETLALSLRRSDATAELVAAGAPGLDGTLPESLHVSGGWDAAITTALGRLADAAVAVSVGEAVDAIRAAREAELGTIRLVIPGADGTAAGKPPAGGTWAADVVTGPTTILATAQRLLSGVLLVEDLADARAAVERQPDLVALTRAGDLVARTHAVGGGGEAASPFELQAAAEEAAEAVREATLRGERIRFALGPARAAREEAAARVAETLSSLHESDAALAAVAERLGRLGGTIRTAQSEAERAEPVIERLQAECAEHEKELAVLVERLDIAAVEPEAAAAELLEASVGRDEANAVARDARRTETDRRLDLRTLEERLTAISGRVASLRKAAEAERVARRRAEERERKRSHDAAVAAEVRERASAGLHSLEASLDAAKDARAAAEAERDLLSERIGTLRAELDTLSLAAAEIADAGHREELARSEQRLRLEQLTERAVSELGMDRETLVDEYGPHLMIPVHTPEGDDPKPPVPYVREEQAKRLARAERDLERLGKVNPLALEEHAALAERHQFLADQLADLKKSRTALLQIVAEIDERVQTVFAAAYADTAAQFEEVFTRLFPGGEGRLVLTDPDDLLTTGIEIEARPAGKKVKRLSLLSGGERSLTAVALLVAIFKARPSPFYVMDEVEAALDDTNLGRLLEIFRELRSDSQLIVVTHQKRTMEIADALYGVTMREGVTTVISQRLDGE